jgi:hypothetical protein
MAVKTLATHPSLEFATLTKKLRDRSWSNKVRHNPSFSVKPTDSFPVRLLVSLLLFRVCVSVLRLAVRRAFS